MNTSDEKDREKKQPENNHECKELRMTFKLLHPELKKQFVSVPPASPLMRSKWGVCLSTFMIQGHKLYTKFGMIVFV